MFCPNYLTSWEMFASTKWNSPKNKDGLKQNSNYMSLEYIHNIVHVSQHRSFAELSPFFS